MPRNKATFNAYVNDAIGYGLDPEVVLYHSENAFGTADAIGFDEKKHLLRIHDLKTGVTRVNMVQLHIYAALFCLEYEKLPGEINVGDSHLPERRYSGRHTTARRHRPYHGQDRLV